MLCVFVLKGLYALFQTILHSAKLAKKFYQAVLLFENHSRREPSAIWKTLFAPNWFVVVFIQHYVLRGFGGQDKCYLCERWGVDLRGRAPLSDFAVWGVCIYFGFFQLFHFFKLSNLSNLLRSWSVVTKSLINKGYDGGFIASSMYFNELSCIL